MRLAQQLELSRIASYVGAGKIGLSSKSYSKFDVEMAAGTCLELAHLPYTYNVETTLYGSYRVVYLSMYHLGILVAWRDSSHFFSCQHAYSQSSDLGWFVSVFGPINHLWSASHLVLMA